MTMKKELLCIQKITRDEQEKSIPVKERMINNMADNSVDATGKAVMPLRFELTVFTCLNENTIN